MKLKKFSVSNLINYIKVSLESDILLSNINVEGEISNLKYHSNGNVYFSLKDNECKVNCILFSQYLGNLDFELKDGEKVSIVGKISVYAKDGTYQIICYMIEKNGLGDLYKEFELLKENLRKKGYFEESHKKPIPSILFNIGVVTSVTGSVIQDILNVYKRKNTLVNIKVFNSLVQGKDAHKELINGIKYFNEKNNVDVIIIARGGGSLEDLWEFNNESLAKEIYNSQIPVVSGVGHETDTTICDFVSDLRASTPTAAAEICIQDLNSIVSLIEDYKKHLFVLFKERINLFKNKVLEKKIEINKYNPKNILMENKIIINNIYNGLNSSMKKYIIKNKDIINNLKIKIEKNNFNSILEKGFVLIYNEQSKFIKSSSEILDSQEISLVFKDGEVKGTFSKKGVEKHKKIKF